MILKDGILKIIYLYGHQLDEKYFEILMDTYFLDI